VNLTQSSVKRSNLSLSPLNYLCFCTVRIGGITIQKRIDESRSFYSHVKLKQFLGGSCHFLGGFFAMWRQQKLTASKIRETWIFKSLEGVYKQFHPKISTGSMSGQGLVINHFVNKEIFKKLADCEIATRLLRRSLLALSLCTIRSQKISSCNSASWRKNKDCFRRWAVFPPRPWPAFLY
jgi:hypothetical protein